MTMLFPLLLLLQLLSCGEMACVRRLLSKQDQEGEMFSTPRLIHQPTHRSVPVNHFSFLFPVFIAEGDANLFLSRHLMFNRFDFEMFVPGNLERECYEEVCNYEEAREVFENTPDTVKWQCHSQCGHVVSMKSAPCWWCFVLQDAFWKKYIAGKKKREKIKVCCC